MRLIKFELDNRIYGGGAFAGYISKPPSQSAAAMATNQPGHFNTSQWGKSRVLALNMIASCVCICLCCLLVPTRTFLQVSCRSTVGRPLAVVCKFISFLGGPIGPKGCQYLLDITVAALCSSKKRCRRLLVMTKR